MKLKPALLLHICCAPCSTHVIDTLKEDFRVTAFFYNPNIHPSNEYSRRLDEMKSYSQKAGIELLIDGYETEMWYEAVKGYESEPEGGKRCHICYALRLERLAKVGKEKGYEYITTTLSTSPYKDAGVLNSIGEEMASSYGLKFYAADFKKKDGFKISCIKARAHDMYRQSYCGCSYTKR